MTTNRVQLRTNIREILRSFNELDVVGTGGIDASATALPVSAVIRYRVGVVLEIADEQMKVETIDSEQSIVGVQRGFNGTTAAAHVAGVQIKIVDEFSDRMLNLAINKAIGDMHPDLYADLSATSLVTSLTTREYAIPTGFTYIGSVEVQNSDGNYIEIGEWKVVNGKIAFDYNFSDGSQNIRVSGAQYQDPLSDDSTNLTVSDSLAMFIVYDGALTALESRIGPRLNATKFSAAVNDRAGQPNEMIQMYNHLKRQAEDIRRRHARPLPSVLSRGSKYFRPMVYQ